MSLSLFFTNVKKYFCAIIKVCYFQTDLFFNRYLQVVLNIGSNKPGGLHILKKVLLGLVQNPVVLMVFVGLIFHFIFNGLVCYYFLFRKFFITDCITFFICYFNKTFDSKCFGIKSYAKSNF